MNPLAKPIYLFADSHLLFFKENAVSFLHQVRAVIEAERPKAAYIGASNGDNPDFYSIFTAAMESIGIEDCRMILSSFLEEDASFCEQSHFILLAGGDAAQGWEVLKRTGLTEILVRKYYEGTVLMGISAGAMQLGLFGWPEVLEPQPEDYFSTLGLVPLIISAHDEKNEWASLKKALTAVNLAVGGVGIPTGGGLAYYPDYSIKPLRYPLHEFVLKDERLTGRLLFPDPPKQIEIKGVH
jgi:cyanophycinase